MRIERKKKERCGKAARMATSTTYAKSQTTADNEKDKAFPAAATSSSSSFSSSNVCCRRTSGLVARKTYREQFRPVNFLPCAFFSHPSFIPFISFSIDVTRNSFCLFDEREREMAVSWSASRLVLCSPTNKNKNGRMNRRYFFSLSLSLFFVRFRQQQHQQQLKFHSSPSSSSGLVTWRVW